MESSGKTTMAAAMAGGYLLGRTKKAKLALGLVMLVAGRRLKLAPADLAMAGARQVAETVDLAALREQVGEQLVGTIKTAASAAVDRQVASMVGSLRERSDALSGLGEALDASGVGGGGKKQAAGNEEDEKHNKEHEEPEAGRDGKRGAESRGDEGREEPEAADRRSDQPRHRGERDGHRRGSGSQHHRHDSRPPREEPKRTPAKRASSQQSSRSGR